MSREVAEKLASLRIDPTLRERASGSSRSALRGAAVLLLVGAGSLVALWGGGWLGRHAAPQVRVTRVEAVTPGGANTRLVATGFAMPRHTVQVGPSVSGRVARRLVEQGEQVEEGTLLLTLDSRAARLAVAAARARASEARARVESTTARLAHARAEAERDRDGAERKLIASAAAERSAAEARALGEQLHAAEAVAQAAATELQARALDLRLRKLVAPVSGTLLSEPPPVGAHLAPGDPSASLEIADLTRIEVRADIPESRVRGLNLGARCEVRFDVHPDRPVGGTLAALGPEVNRAKGTMLARVHVDVRDLRVFPGMSAHVRFVSTAAETQRVAPGGGTIRVPRSALRQRGERRVVFVLEEGRVREVAVRLAREGTSEGYVLRDGPAVGTRIVDSPPPELRDGMKVEEES